MIRLQDTMQPIAEKYKNSGSELAEEQPDYATSFATQVYTFIDNFKLFNHFQRHIA